MGVCINQRLGLQKVYIKDALDQAEQYAKNIKKTVFNDNITVDVRRPTDYQLLIDISGCETLSFNFKSAKEVNKAGAEGWDYMYAVLTDNSKKELDEGYKIEKYPHNEKYYSADFTKTQFADNVIAHKIVADIIKIVASRCFYAEVNDEGDYYHSGKLGDAVKNIRSNGIMIDGLMGALTGDNNDNIQIVKGETKIGK